MQQLLSLLNSTLESLHGAAEFKSSTYHFGSRLLTVRMRKQSEAALPHGGLVRYVPADHAPTECPTKATAVTLLEESEARHLVLPATIQLGPYGGVPASEGAEWLVLRSPDTGRFLALHRGRREALYYPGSPVPPRERAEFLRPLLHWSAILDGNVVIHAGGVSRDGQGVLIAGTGNTGKSTLTRACLASGFRFLGDNVIEVGRDRSGAVRLWPVYPTIKIRPGSVLPIPSSWPEPSWDDEAEKEVYFLAELLLDGFSPEPVTHSATLVLDEQGPGCPAPMSSGEAFFRIVPNTVGQFPLFAREVLARTKELVCPQPVFTAGRMPLSNLSEAVEELLMETGAAAHGR